MDGNTSQNSKPKYNIVFQVESFEESQEELNPLFERHFKEIETPIKELNPNYELYYFAESLGKLCIVTIRDEEKLVGYCCSILEDSLMNKEKTIASINLIYVEPKYRRGIIIIKFFKFIEKIFKKNNVTYMTIAVTDKLDYSKFLKYIGFKKLEMVYSKEFV